MAVITIDLLNPDENEEKVEETKQTPQPSLFLPQVELTLIPIEIDVYIPQD